ncbi:molybdopterin-dependent oxidoreductase [Paracoccus shanxieyensis]|uniref:Molybdopterin-dependent oxidoreductase n=1 Tax=Paracoccus shanxieyensis TaxID=2675752 RepID=A0A6L6J352_9RHOB|nr:molybdopterin-dependent oxidoreductase [Paracoccus shanxieyensis]MTH65680.1 molybdopterin-dependent oxidoreductase [Paracoccus shanxieyensis]MTH88745.1 molybdopterin-dependent oxidoreductase [Paracoccus shanxieyensis]
MSQIRSFCTLCRSQCGTINVVEGGRLVEVRPDPHHPTGQAACRKGKAAPEMLAANNRILYPMRRTTPKTDPDPGWERLSWDQALDIVAARLTQIRDTHGPEAVGFLVTTKSGTAIADGIEWVDRFTRVFGSPNVTGATEICNWHKDSAHKFTFGCAMPMPDYENAGLILLWGHNPTSTWLSQADAIGRGRANGAQMIVVDPRPTALAQAADLWLRVRPGTDAALAMGLSRLLIGTGQVKWDFVTGWTNAPLLVRGDTGRFLRAADLSGHDDPRLVAWDRAQHAPVPYDTRHALPKSADFALDGRMEVTLADGRSVACRPAFDLFRANCAEWTPERVEQVCGVPAPDLRRAADLLAAHGPVAYYAWNGVGQNTNATQTERALATLYALCGSFDEPGGNRVLATHKINAVDSPALMPLAQQQKAIGAAERPLGPPAQGRIKALDLYRAAATGKPYPLKAFFAFGTNHLATQGDEAEVRAGFESAEFHVHCECVDTPTARYADIVLPVNLPWEREGLRVGFDISPAANELIQLRPAAVPPMGEARSDTEIVFDLAVRLGFGDMFFGGDPEAGQDHILAPLNVTSAELRAAGGQIRRPLEQGLRKYRKLAADGTVAGFDTPTRRVEFYSEFLLGHGQAPLPHHPLPADGADSALPLLMTSMKNGYFCHSQHRGIASLRRRQPEPGLWLHPDLALARGIAPGDLVRAFNSHGAALFRAHTDALLAPGVVAAEFGWWESCEPLGRAGPKASNFNALVSADARDPISGSVAHKAVPCDIERADDPAIQPWTGTRRFVVSALSAEGSEAMRVTMTPEDGGPLPDFLPGQHLSIGLPGAGTQVPLVRSYSLTSPAILARRDSYELCIGRALDASGGPGKASSYVNDRLAVGEIVTLETPNGNFTIPTQSKAPLILIATGIGITPFVSYLETLLDQVPRPQVLLIYGNKSRQTQAYGARLAELAALMPELTVLCRYSRDPLVDAALIGRIGPDLIPDALIAQSPRVYLCGSQAMIDGFTGPLKGRGVPGFDIFSEEFRSPIQLPTTGNETFEVEFRRSGKRAMWTAASGTLLELAERSGVPAASGCRVGQCESCAVRVLGGDVAHLVATALDDASLALACCAIPASKVVLDM